MGNKPGKKPASSQSLGPLMLRCGSNYEPQPACKEDTGVAPGEALDNEDTVQHHLPPIRNAPTDTGPGLLSRKAQPSRDPTWYEWSLFLLCIICRS